MTYLPKNIHTPDRRGSRLRKQDRVDSLAISIGTSHGAFKFKSGRSLKYVSTSSTIEKRIPASIAHGSSSVPQDIVAEIISTAGTKDL